MPELGQAGVDAPRPWVRLGDRSARRDIERDVRGSHLHGQIVGVHLTSAGQHHRSLVHAEELGHRGRGRYLGHGDVGARCVPECAEFALERAPGVAFFSDFPPLPPGCIAVQDRQFPYGRAAALLRPDKALGTEYGQRPVDRGARSAVPGRQLRLRRDQLAGCPSPASIASRIASATCMYSGRGVSMVTSVPVFLPARPPVIFPETSRTFGVKALTPLRRD